MSPNALLLGVDGGGTQCRARLCTFSGDKLGEAIAGPANIRFGLERSFEAILQAATACLEQAGLSSADFVRTIACLAVAGVGEPSHLAAAQNYENPFAKMIVTSDAHAACIGAHGGRDGGVIVIGTGSIGWAELRGLHYHVGGWGWPISDEGSGAWLGHEALRRVLWAYDGRIEWSPLLRELFARFESDPYAILRWATQASPRDLASIARSIVEHSLQYDRIGRELMRLAAGHIDALAHRLIELGTERLALVGGLASHIEPWLVETTRSHLTAPQGDALDGALRLAKAAADGQLSFHFEHAG
ncbi:MAG TPA: BadF/BadG/BcrA/BcrD ATPase family protein [Xanthobacteraceae bacterium]|nr:BadF/BadG/BcrA/BcrD ATPase family protein [Xanthobacteraceae bacterium]